MLCLSCVVEIYLFIFLNVLSVVIYFLWQIFSLVSGQFIVTREKLIHILEVQPSQTSALSTPPLIIVARLWFMTIRKTFCDRNEVWIPNKLISNCNCTHWSFSAILPCSPSIGCGRKMPYNTWYRFIEYHNLMSSMITDRQASTSPFHRWLVAMLSALFFFSLSPYPATLCTSPPSHCLQLTHFENPTVITILILDFPWVHFSHADWIMLLSSPRYPQHWSFSHLLISLAWSLHPEGPSQHNIHSCRPPRTEQFLSLEAVEILRTRCIDLRHWILGSFLTTAVRVGGDISLTASLPIAVNRWFQQLSTITEISDPAFTISPAYDQLSLFRPRLSSCLYSCFWNEFFSNSSPWHREISLKC